MTLASRYALMSSVAFGEHTVADAAMPLKSEIDGVSDIAWTNFVRAMMTQSHDRVSESNCIGMFELTPRRLADLGLIKPGSLARGKSKKGRTIWAAELVDGIRPDTLLKSPRAQYRIFSLSMKKYADDIAGGTIAKNETMSLAGALAILHRAGPHGLKSETLFPATQAAFIRAKDIF